jgi:hypothetical protein
MRAILLASATATTLKGRRARSCVSQGYFPGFSWARRNTANRPDDENARLEIGPSEPLVSRQRLCCIRQRKSRSPILVTRARLRSSKETGTVNDTTTRTRRFCGRAARTTPAQMVKDASAGCWSVLPATLSRDTLGLSHVSLQEAHSCARGCDRNHRPRETKFIFAPL